MTEQEHIKELEEQIEDMKSCCICAKLNRECKVFEGKIPEHNLNDAPCEEWELG